MLDLTRFSIAEVLECSAALSKIGADARSMEELAQAVAAYLYDNFGRTANRREILRPCALLQNT